MFAFIVSASMLGTPAGCEPDLSQFAVAWECYEKSDGRNHLHEDYQRVIDLYKSQPAYWWGRNRQDLQNIVGELELAQSAWNALYYAKNSTGNSRYWSAYLRETIGEEYFRAGIMPPFPGVGVRVLP